MFIRRYYQCILLSLVLCTPLLAQEKKAEVKKEPELTEIQKLKIENLKLKTQVAQCSATVSDRETKLASYELTFEQQKLLKELREQLNAKETDTFDWNSFKFSPAIPDSK